ncbi:hypothetical protein GSI_15484 [Ganoderma sinense ZZ0214-1]|uniref:Uncharacterized protein n=1 Tax=Ganoderma sinense ZZ0214-1 TaxID=1077348 RepID=A0A2G8RMQ7_9APHY|nr:hypothetical protein GSI_15484 [Ganoderma sinense ZZ0214-1]
MSIKLFIPICSARLNSHRNTFTPISKLPPEVLGRIFEFTVAPESEFLENLSEFPPSIPPRLTAWYHNLLLVCTWWAKVATTCPRMWYHIVDDDMIDRAPRRYMTRYYPQVVLRRSGQATPLHLYTAVPPRPTPESVPWWIIKNQPVRVNALHITLRDARTQSEALLESLATSLPSLRLLTVDAHRSSYAHAIGQDMPIILCGEVLNLEALTWSIGVPFLPGNTFPSLAHLNLHERSSIFRDDICCLDSILRLLSNCPRLETLVFAQSSLDVATGMGPDRGPVRLNHLRALWVQGQDLAVNSALKFLSYLDLPKDATVRLSNLSELDPDYPSEPTEPPTSLPFLAQMDCPARLDVIHCEGGHRDDAERYAFHFIVVGPRSRFWLHMPGNSTIALHCLALLYKMLPKEPIETVRVSVLTMRGFTFLPLILGQLPSLTTLLVRHSKVSSPVVAAAGVAALVRALGPGRGSVNNVPAPRLKTVGLELTCTPTTSLAPLVSVFEERKKCCHPLATVQHKLVGVDMRDVDEMKEHVTEGLGDVDGKLWIPVIDEGWRVKNDYWRLYPTPWDEYSGWGFSLEEW